MEFRDKRLKSRFEILLNDLTEKPSSSIPKACSSAPKTKAAYRFFDNDRVEAEKIRQGFFKATKKRVSQHKDVLLISDLSGLNYSNHKKLKGTGVLKNFKARGLIIHSCFAVTPESEPLGLLYQHFWGRKPEDYGKRKERIKLPIEKKESYYWIESLLKSQSQIPSKTKATFICDRGGDMIDLFLQKRKPNINLLIRANYNRRIDKSKKLFDELNKSKILGNMEVSIGRSNNRKPRIAKFSVHAIEATLKRNKDQSKVKINVVLAKEIQESNVETPPISWRLLTTIPIKTLEDAKKVITLYSKRWLIERYHYALKSGCKIEELQLEDSCRIERAVATYCIVAWRLMYLTYFARIKPNAPCNGLLTKIEWESLFCFLNKKRTPPKKPPIINDAVLWLAKLGGFLARKADGNPGMKVIWRGLSRLEDISKTYSIFR